MTIFNGDLPCNGLSEKGEDEVGWGHVLGVGRTLAFSYHLCPLHFYTSPTLLTHSVEFNLLLFLVLSLFFFSFSAIKGTHKIHTTLDSLKLRNATQIFNRKKCSQYAFYNGEVCFVQPFVNSYQCLQASVFLPMVYTCYVISSC